MIKNTDELQVKRHTAGRGVEEPHVQKLLAVEELGAPPSWCRLSPV